MIAKLSLQHFLSYNQKHDVERKEKPPVSIIISRSFILSFGLRVLWYKIKPFAFERHPCNKALILKLMPIKSNLVPSTFRRKRSWERFFERYWERGWIKSKSVSLFSYKINAYDSNIEWTKLVKFRSFSPLRNLANNWRCTRHCCVSHFVVPLSPFLFCHFFWSTVRCQGKHARTHARPNGSQSQFLAAINMAARKQFSNSVAHLPRWHGLNRRHFWRNGLLSFNIGCRI